MDKAIQWNVAKARNKRISILLLRKDSSGSVGTLVKSGNRALQMQFSSEPPAINSYTCISYEQDVAYFTLHRLL